MIKYKQLPYKFSYETGVFIPNITANMYSLSWIKQAPKGYFKHMRWNILVCTEKQKEIFSFYFIFLDAKGNQLSFKVISR